LSVKNLQAWRMTASVLGAGFSDVGVTVVRRSLADVREAPRHEIA